MRTTILDNLMVIFLLFYEVVHSYDLICTYFLVRSASIVRPEYTQKYPKVLAYSNAQPCKVYLTYLTHTCTQTRRSTHAHCDKMQRISWATYYCGRIPELCVQSMQDFKNQWCVYRRKMRYAYYTWTLA